MYVIKNEYLCDQINYQNNIELQNALLTEYTYYTKRHDSTTAEQAKKSELNKAKELILPKELMNTLATQLNCDGLQMRPSLIIRKLLYDLFPNAV